MIGKALKLKAHRTNTSTTKLTGDRNQWPLVRVDVGKESGLEVDVGVGVSNGIYIYVVRKQWEVHFSEKQICQAVGSMSSRFSMP